MDTIRRSIAEAELDQTIPMYSDGDDRWIRYEELYAEVDAEGSALPPEQWRDGYWDAGEYIVEATEVGIYERVDTVAMIATRYSDGKSLWTYGQMRDEVFPAKSDRQLTYEDWLAASLNTGAYTKVDVIEYRDEEADEVIHERLIVDG
ncbi:hypothetical protein [Mycobacterium sp. 852002-51961_SCH5331710]|uniref:hypothetical protein n=1 Tax=Mycobacterium sp. 852002-51961_SCH5331710 TaxID=1834105 RepID=UPI0007FC47D6|nr:hypothetical protein [Mycobacterium sp. 852002-51961_SCH5331710]OBB45428.1 hypothetical protein A5752_02070 [Mycobacterium sp. 852002-51961_SCH5331710]